MWYLIYFISLLFLNSCINGSKNHMTSNSKNGMVVSGHPEASKIGLDILKKGGNAIDAAVAVQYALAVCYPIAGNLGGGGFMLYRPSNGECIALDFREKAPSKSHRDMYLNEEGEVMKNKSLYGSLSAGVPGTVDGIFTMYKKYGSLPMKDLIKPAINLAENGFKISANQARHLNKYQDDFKAHNPLKKYIVNDDGWKKSDLLVQLDLAETLRRILDNGRSGFYDGETAELIVNTMDSTGGIITKDDLLEYKSVWREPIVGRYKEYKFYSMCPPSSGGIILKQLLCMSEQVDFSQFEHNSVEYIHLLTEMERRAYADRAKYMGDHDYVKVPIKKLTNRKYILERFKTINKQKASISKEISHGEFQESEETTHFSIVDKQGNAVSITTTLNGAYGSKSFVAGAGFLLNNEMDDFSVKPGYPNLYGLVGGEANAIAPGKRMLSSMTPTILEKNNSLFMVIGSPGGSTIITSVFQNILNVIEFKMGMQESVNSVRFHHQWKPDKIFYEEGHIKENILIGLKTKGHNTFARRPIGRVDAILINEDGVFEGGADPRGDDTKLSF